MGLKNRLRCLDAGADDYLIKPFANAELVSRIRANVRRARGATDDTYKVRDLRLDETRQLVIKGDDVLNLSRTEFAIISELVINADKVVTRSRLINRALNDGESQTLDVHLSNLRKKIGSDYIRTVRGVGYIIDAIKMEMK